MDCCSCLTVSLMASSSRRADPRKGARHAPNLLARRSVAASTASCKRRAEAAARARSAGTRQASTYASASGSRSASDVNGGGSSAAGSDR
eukprot:CAMPEP_0118811866 /NCGR_PEP_ID=MMETSP1162-20130426/1937_1 /TAXON_ID=33656 /ORGANISM="Phaeocystis Sp, Strain CCMP2710" /LENGTH=89 /DNA_ID=CAMNT_0006741543 /DNA_START=212 /DNA_END=481 /DNA_ORIENTATION=+